MKRILNIKLLSSYNNKELIIFLYNHFHNKYPKKIQELKDNFFNAKYDQMKKTIHEIKNLFANIGAEGPAEFCETLELKKFDHFVKNELIFNKYINQMNSDYERCLIELKMIVHK